MSVNCFLQTRKGLLTNKECTRIKKGRGKAAQQENEHGIHTNFVRNEDHDFDELSLFMQLFSPSLSFVYCSKRKMQCKRKCITGAQNHANKKAKDEEATREADFKSIEGEASHEMQNKIEEETDEKTEGDSREKLGKESIHHTVNSRKRNRDKAKNSRMQSADSEGKPMKLQWNSIGIPIGIFSHCIAAHSIEVKS